MIVLTGPPESKARQRKLGILNYRAPEGAEKRLCQRCGKKFWLGPTQLEALDQNPTAELACFACAFKEAEKTGGLNLAHLGGEGGVYRDAREN